MITPMTKISMLLPAGEEQLALETLRDLGVLHIQAQRKEPGPQQRQAIADEAAIAQLQDRLRDLDQRAAESSEQLTAEQIQEAAEHAFTGVETTTAELENLVPVLEALRPWGEFDPAMLGEFQKRGLYVRLCIGTPSEQKILGEAGYTCVPVAEAGQEHGKSKLFAVFSDQPLDKAPLPVADMPLNRPLSVYEAEATALQERRKQANETLARLKDKIPLLKERQKDMQEETVFCTARESMLSRGGITGISGFVPDDKLAPLLDTARQHRWGVVHEPADRNDAVPTLLKKPRWARLLDPMLEFLTLSPGYNEADVSIPVMFFLTIFFGILIADVVYGVLFLIIAVLLLLTKGRTNPALRLSAGLLLLFSLSSIFWGVLTGNYGGIEGPGLPYLSEEPDKDNHMKIVCFAIGAVHLSLGHVLRIFRHPSIRHIMAQIGWIMLLVGNFFLIITLLSLVEGPFPKWVIWNYAIGFVLLLAGEINFRDISTMLSCPLEIISSFSDILSYIRLFAVCLAGFCLAKVFDDIAFGLMKSSVPGFIFGSILLLFGHLMNIALGGLAILVHAVRLNTLEFSSHSLVRWAGFPFAPFRRKTDKV